MSTPSNRCCHKHYAAEWASHVANGLVFGAKDQNGNWLVPSGPPIFLAGYWPNVSGYYPTSLSQLQAPYNSPCPSGSFKCVNGDCVSGVYTRYYDNYENTTPPKYYHSAKTALDITINGITSNTALLQDGSCESLNGSFRLADMSAIQKFLNNNITYKGLYYNYGIDLPVNITDLCYLGSVALNTDSDGASVVQAAGYSYINLYLFLAGSDAIDAAKDVTPSGMYWRKRLNSGFSYYDRVELTEEYVVYRANEMDTKPNIWLMAEFVNYMQPLPIESGYEYGDLLNPTLYGWGTTYGIYGTNIPLTDILLHERSMPVSKSSLFSYGRFPYYGYDGYMWTYSPYICSVFLAKPIMEYNGDYIQNVATEFNTTWGHNYSSIIPYQPRCSLNGNYHNEDDEYQMYNYGNFDGLDFNISVDFTPDDIVFPIDKKIMGHIVRYGGYNWNYYAPVSGDMMLACNLNFNLTISTVAESDQYVQNDIEIGKQAYPSLHIQGEVFSYCDHESTFNKGIIGFGALLSTDPKDYYPGTVLYDPFYDYNPSISVPLDPTTGDVCTVDPMGSWVTYNGTCYTYHWTDPAVPYGSLPTLATVTISGVKSLDRYDGGNKTCQECDDCENLDGSYSLVYEPQAIINTGYGIGGYYSNYVRQSSYAVHRYQYAIEAKSYDNDRNLYPTYHPFGSICCPCDSGFCVNKLELVIYPYKHSTAIYDPAYFGPVVSTAVSLYLYQSSYRYGSYGYEETKTPIAKYTYNFNNINFVDISGYWGAFPTISTRSCGLINPLPLSAFTDVELVLESGDSRYVKDALAEGELAAACSLPDTIKVSLEPVTQYNKLATINYGNYNPTIYGLNNVFQTSYQNVVFSRSVSDIAVVIPNGWQTSALIPSSDVSWTRYQLGCNCDVEATFLGRALHIPENSYYPFWQTYEYDCDELHDKYLVDVQKVQCRDYIWGMCGHYIGDLSLCCQTNYYRCPVRIKSTYTYPVYSLVTRNCDNPSQSDRTFKSTDPCWVFDPGEQKCGISMELNCSKDDLPQGTYSLSVAPADYRYSYGSMRSSCYDFVTREPGSCNRAVANPAWTYFEDPCNIMTLQEYSGYADPYNPCTENPNCNRHNPEPNEDECIGNGIDCSCKAHYMQLVYEVDTVTYDPVYEYWERPKIRFHFQVFMKCDGYSFAHYEGGYGPYPRWWGDPGQYGGNWGGGTYSGFEFISDWMDLELMGACNGLDATWLFDISKLDQLELRPASLGSTCNTVGSFFWDGSSVRLILND